MRWTWIAALLAALFQPLAASPAARAQEVTVFAAASLANALDEVAGAFAAGGKGRIRASYAASSSLARQIERGAPADLFISADQEWMDYLAQRRLIDSLGRMNLLGNDMVLIASAASSLKPFDMVHGTSLVALAGNGRIATGDPDHVPVGRYARQALEALGQWREVEPRLARLDSVRAALAMVERDEAPLGIVYATDAAASRKVKVLAVFPGKLHAPIVYPAALVAGGGNPAARDFLAFLASPQAKGIFARHGFKLN